MNKILRILVVALFVVVLGSCTRMIPSMSVLENDDAVMRVHLPKMVMKLAGDEIAESLGPKSKINSMDIYVFRNGVSTGIGRKMLSDMKHNDSGLSELLAAEKDGEQAFICGRPKKGADGMLNRMVIAAFEEKEGCLLVLDGTIDLEGIVLEESGLIDIAKSKK